MAEPIINVTDYPTVRGAISIDLDRATLPDETIALSIYQGAAEMWARGLDSAADTRTGVELDKLKMAICLKTAALLCPAIPVITREDFQRGEGVSRQPMDPLARANSLNDRALILMDDYLDLGTLEDALPPVFASCFNDDPCCP